MIPLLCKKKVHTSNFEDFKRIKNLYLKSRKINNIETIQFFSKFRNENYLFFYIIIVLHDEGYFKDLTF